MSEIKGKIAMLDVIKNVKSMKIPRKECGSNHEEDKNCEMKANGFTSQANFERIECGQRELILVYFEISNGKFCLESQGMKRHRRDA